jgi:K+/H+ antiporter YhaU regulatory subunit KhtT
VPRRIGFPNEIEATKILTAGLFSENRRTNRMCQSCVEIDEQIERHRELLRSTRDEKEIERINRLVSKLYADRVRLHQNPER